MTNQPNTQPKPGKTPAQPPEPPLFPAFPEPTSWALAWDGHALSMFSTNKDKSRVTPTDK
jgi:hypothetical protein